KGLKKHIPKCKDLNNASQQLQMPEKNRSIKAFYNHKCMQPNPYHIIWNFKMLTEKIIPEEKMKLTHTERMQKHKLYGYCYMVIHMDSLLNYEIMNYNLYRGLDALKKFVDRIKEELINIQADLSVLAKIIMPSQEALQKFEEAKHRLLEVNEWEACMREDHLEKKKIQKEYKEALSFFETKVPLICHNFWGYNSHPLMKIVSKFTADKLNCIPKNIEKYKAMDIEQLRFLDSFQHMEMELDKLVKYLGKKLKNSP
ncbi:2877_t:CDS:2, partial [Gigaspora margarita]